MRMTSRTDRDYRPLHEAMTDRLERLGRSLNAEQWRAPSLCNGWRTCDVFGHMTYGGVTPMYKAVPLLLFRYRANLNRGSLLESIRFADEHDQSELLDAFVRASRAPVGIGKRVKPADLHVDHLVHELDVRRPLGLRSEFSTQDLLAALDPAMSAKSPLFSPGKTANGLRFRATDIDWQGGGTGGSAIVEGPAEDLLLALAGRRVGLATLSGDGVAELARRLG